jgi:hypothetical protein
MVYSLEQRVPLSRVYSVSAVNPGAWKETALNGAADIATKRQFFLYWLGFLIVILASVAVLMTISGLLIEVLNYRCWYPVLSPLLGFGEPPQPTQISEMPVYCVNPAVAVVRFAFNFLAELVVVGAGVYMMMNGKKN